MKILFMGTPDFAVPSLNKLIESEHELVGVVCQPDRPKGRSKKLVHLPTKKIAVKNSIKVFQPIKIRTDEFFSTIKQLNPDLIAVVAYGKILPENILEYPRYKCINVHASLLPKYRGAAPVNWAIAKGEKKTGITTMLMDKGMDTGDILLTDETDIKNNESSVELAERLSELGAELLLKTISLYQEGKISPVKQNDSEATYAPLMKKEDGKIDWTKSAEEIRDLIRGMQPWPNAFTTLEGKNLKIYDSAIIEGTGKPGEIYFVNKDNLEIGTGKNLLNIKELQLEGSRRMKIKDFLSGRELNTGMILGK